MPRKPCLWAWREAVFTAKAWSVSSRSCNFQNTSLHRNQARPILQQEWKLKTVYKHKCPCADPSRGNDYITLRGEIALRTRVKRRGREGVGLNPPINSTTLGLTWVPDCSLGTSLGARLLPGTVYRSVPRHQTITIDTTPSDRLSGSGETPRC
ncbi:hypothetical protein Bbelb_214600 [Branchiostoma belcheri]|nr:hypothetical protein Bbelb_214600 [Branchiostoma belcheri]